MKKYLPFLTALVIGGAAAPQLSAQLADGINILAWGNCYFEQGKEGEFNVNITNNMDEPLTKIAYTIEYADDDKTTQSYEVEFPAIASKAKKYIPLVARGLNELGNYSMIINVNAVNGYEFSTSRKGVMRVVKQVPEHICVVEDYTGTWCGWCPRGFVAMEGINRDYHGKILTVAYHNGDPMAVTGFNPPMAITSYPSLTLNRTNGNAGTIGNDALKIANSLAPCVVKVEDASWTASTDGEDGDVDCKVTASVEFLNATAKGEYNIEFILIEDGVKGETSKWNQTNYYSGSDTEWDDPLWDVFTKGASKVSGLTFNDVCIANSLQLPGDLVKAIPATPAEEPITYEFTFSNVNKIRESGNATKSILQNPDKCRVACVITNSSNIPVNAAWKGVTDAAGINTVAADASFNSGAPAEYFNLSGVKVNPNALTPGIYVIRQGTKTSKVVIR